MGKKLEDKTEQCPLIEYCIDCGATVSPIKVCKGIEGDYVQCGAFQHYAEEGYYVYPALHVIIIKPINPELN